MRVALHRSGCAQRQVERKAMARIAEQLERLPLGVTRSEFIAAHVAWRSGQWDSERPAGAFCASELQIRSFDRDLLIGLDAGDVERENIRRFARRQSRLPAFAPGFLVYGFRLPALFQFGVDFDLAEADSHIGDRRIAGQRETIDGLQRLFTLLAGEAVGLSETQSGQRPRDLTAEFSSFERDKRPGLTRFRLVVVCDLQHSDSVWSRIGTG